MHVSCLQNIIYYVTESLLYDTLWYGKVYCITVKCMKAWYGRFLRLFFYILWSSTTLSNLMFTFCITFYIFESSYINGTRSIHLLFIWKVKWFQAESLETNINADIQVTICSRDRNIYARTCRTQVLNWRLYCIGDRM